MTRLFEKDILNEVSKYKHCIGGQVKFHEVDSFRVVHNVQYFYFCEWARTKYLESCGIEFNHSTFTSSNPLMTVYHEMNYFNPLMLSDEYEIYTRTSAIGNSSITIDNIIKSLDGKIMIKLSSTLVYLNTVDYRPSRIPEDLRNKILLMEGNDIIVQEG